MRGVDGHSVTRVGEEAVKDPGEQQREPKRPDNRLHLAGALIVTKTLKCAVLGNLLMGAFLLFPENEEAR